MKYTVRLDRGPQKCLDGLHGDAYTRIVFALRALVDNPRPHGVKKLKGRRDYWRIRVGDYRIIYMKCKRMMLTADLWRTRWERVFIRRGTPWTT